MDKETRRQELLAELRRLRKENPLYFYNHPTLSSKPQHVKQMKFHAMRQKTRLFSGGNQSGKSTAGLVDDLIQGVDEDVLPDHLKIFKVFDPPFLCRILAPSVSVLELTIFEKLRELMPRDQYIGGTWGSSYNKELRVLRLKNGTAYQFMTYEQDVDKMGGATMDRIHYDEEPPYRMRVENRLRVMRRGGDEIFTLTPLMGLSWAYEDLWEMRGEEQEENLFINEEYDLGVIVVDMDDNPWLSEKEKEYALRGLSLEERQARKEGKFVHFAGLIYNEFSPQDHVIPAFIERNSLPENVNIIVGIDPGIRNRAAVLFTYIDANDNMVVFDELYEQGKTVREICDQIHKLNTKWQILPIYYVIDPAARNHNHQTGRSDQMEYSDHGIVTIAGQNRVEPGINRIKERLQTNRLFITSNCVNLIKEFKKYRWKEPPRSGEDGRPVPVKTEDHLMDALRYVVMSRPYLPKHLQQNNETYLQRLMREDRERYRKPISSSSSVGGIMHR